jgi:asparaginyl-tRNA synthetase
MSRIRKNMWKRFKLLKSKHARRIKGRSAQEGDFFNFRNMKDKIATAKLERQVIKSMRNCLEEEGFIEIFPPKIVRASGSCENVDTLFEVGVEGNFCWFHSGTPHRAYLSQTAQLYLEAFVPYLKKVYSVGPSFRAEPGNDNRHLIEFVMLEIEFAGNFKELLKHIEKVIYRMVKDILNLPAKIKKELGFGKKEVERLEKMKPIFPKITYDKAIKILKLPFGSDISWKNEQKLMAKFDGHPIFITHYPNPLWNHKKEIEVEKFFNMIPDPENPSRVLSADLILPFGGEAIGAAQRVHKFGELKWRLENSRMFKRLENKGGGMEDFSWYLEKVREKSVPHAGCGFGMARILKFLKGEEDIKKVIAFPSNQENII